jgi:adenylate cyclase
MLLVCVFIAAFVLTFHTIAKNLSVFAAGLVLILAVAAVLFSARYYVPTTYLVVALLMSFILSAIFSYALEGRERQFIKRTFSQYMDKTIVEHVLQNPDIVRPGGKKARVTVLFADIAGFTTISERNTPEDTALMLHRVLNELTEVVIEEKGWWTNISGIVSWHSGARLSKLRRTRSTPAGARSSSSRPSAG